MTLCVHVAAFTHPGMVRPHNEDCIAVGQWLGQETMQQPIQFTLPLEEPLLCLVADGLGGHAAGEVASRYAAERLSAEAGALSKDEQAVAACLHQINAELRAQMRSHPHQTGMATTVAGLLIASTRVIAFNVGDSRIYRRRSNRLLQVSTDDTPEAVYFGVVDTCCRSHIITQCLGGLELERELTPHLVTQPLEKEELYLLCSDGLTDMLNRYELEENLSDNLQETVVKLFQAASAAGGNDNISILLIRINTKECWQN